ncbi:hypothetical protein [Tenuifilum osseticum]|uniref:hypothetical protein n=1 Tax=Tenuifilum osseticum TaxID=3374723 RepID=UPI0034E3AE53
MLSVAEASLFYHQFLSLLVGFPAVALCNAFLLRRKASTLLFGKSVVCIAVHVGLPWRYKYFAPTGLEALFVVRESLIVVRKRTLNPLHLSFIHYPLSFYPV